MYSKILLLLLLIIAGCSPALFLPDENDAKLVNKTLPELLHGRDLYINKCGSCHNLYLPEQFEIARWNEILAEMKTRSKTNDEEEEKIRSFLISALNKAK